MASEKRLIDANALNAEICKDCGNGCDLVDDYCILAGEIMKASTVDAVEVVRCKDCKYRNEHDDCTHKWWMDAEGWYKYVGDDDFCSYGERKEKPNVTDQTMDALKKMGEKVHGG